MSFHHKPAALNLHYSNSNRHHDSHDTSSSSSSPNLASATRLFQTRSCGPRGHGGSGENPIGYTSGRTSTPRAPPPPLSRYGSSNPANDDASICSPHTTQNNSLSNHNTLSRSRSIPKHNNSLSSGGNAAVSRAHPKTPNHLIRRTDPSSQMPPRNEHVQTTATSYKQALQLFQGGGNQSLNRNKVTLASMLNLASASSVPASSPSHSKSKKHLRANEETEHRKLEDSRTLIAHEEMQYKETIAHIGAVTGYAYSRDDIIAGIRQFSSSYGSDEMQTDVDLNGVVLWLMENRASRIDRQRMLAAASLLPPTPTVSPTTATTSFSGAPISSPSSTQSLELTSVASMNHNLSQTRPHAVGAKQNFVPSNSANDRNNALNHTQHGDNMTVKVKKKLEGSTTLGELVERTLSGIQSGNYCSRQLHNSDLDQQLSDKVYDDPMYKANKCGSNSHPITNANKATNLSTQSNTQHVTKNSAIHNFQDHTNANSQQSSGDYKAYRANNTLTGSLSTACSASAVSTTPPTVTIRQHSEQSQQSLQSQHSQHQPQPAGFELRETSAASSGHPMTRSVSSQPDYPPLSRVPSTHRANNTSSTRTGVSTMSPVPSLSRPKDHNGRESDKTTTVRDGDGACLSYTWSSSPSPARDGLIQKSTSAASPAKAAVNDHPFQGRIMTVREKAEAVYRLGRSLELFRPPAHGTMLLPGASSQQLTPASTQRQKLLQPHSGLSYTFSGSSTDSHPSTRRTMMKTNSQFSVEEEEERMIGEDIINDRLRVLGALPHPPSAQSASSARTRAGDFSMIVMASDGNCLFRAIAHQLWGMDDSELSTTRQKLMQEEGHQEVRRRTVQHMRDHSAEYSVYFDPAYLYEAAGGVPHDNASGFGYQSNISTARGGTETRGSDESVVELLPATDKQSVYYWQHHNSMTLNHQMSARTSSSSECQSRLKPTESERLHQQEWVKYCDLMGQTGTWGDELTLKAACNAFNVTIHLLTSERDHFYMVYRPTYFESGGRTSHQHSGACSDRNICLAYISPVHYNSICYYLFDEKTNLKTTSVF